MTYFEYMRSVHLPAEEACGAALDAYLDHMINTGDLTGDPAEALRRRYHQARERAAQTAAGLADIFYGVFNGKETIQ